MPIVLDFDSLGLAVSLLLTLVSLVFFISFYRRPIAYSRLFEKYKAGVYLLVLSFGPYAVVEVLEALENPLADALEDFIYLVSFSAWIAIFLYYLYKSRGLKQG